MMNLLTAIPTGLTAFVATNMDDILMLLLFFSQVNAVFRNRHIVAGQYLGFGALVLASLPGFFGSLVFPRPWIGLLGVIPIAIGINRLLNPEEEELEELSAPEVSAPSLTSLLSPQTYSVAAITFANGGDNIGIYVPLFASNSLEELLVILGTFFSLVGIWCYTAYRLSRLPLLAATLTRYGNLLVPYVLIGLGVLILIDGHTLEDRGLTVLTLVLCCFCLLTFNRSHLDGATTDNEEK
uniref:Cadmium resistance transporter n=1 Tax=Cyanothece sp. (strain PCC 7425 / ATCC 29141) TaxID=395961 RepID=B8HKW0_CYAP4